MMAKIPRKFIAVDGTEFDTAAEARAHNELPSESVAAFLDIYPTTLRRRPEYARVLMAYDAWASDDGK